jgi:hypothetical protein
MKIMANESMAAAWQSAYHRNEMAKIMASMAYRKYQAAK